MIKLEDIRAAMASGDWGALHALFIRANEGEHIERTTWLTAPGLRVAMAEAALFKGSEGFDVLLMAMLDAIERGVSPQRDPCYRAEVARQALAAKPI